ncbi:MAG: bifunctional phosphoribosylaminoimidazolecarboxamide formyltransferase/IMP cyclohydrolase [Pyrinomonadaceae bacterium]
MSESRKIKRALFSLSDKTGAVEFARALTSFGIEIISTGGTAAALRQGGLAVTDVSEVTGFPEIMDGRVKTLHPKIHGALLGLRDKPDHLEAMALHQIEPIDLVAIDLYPFENAIAKVGVTLAEAVENIDIGGPAIMRSASKNWRDVAVVTDARMYVDILAELNENDGGLSLETRSRLALLAYTRTAAYDLAISSYLSKQLTESDLDYLEPYNPLQNLTFIESEDLSDAASAPDRSLSEIRFAEDRLIELAKVADLRYGENPHQNAALYVSDKGGGIANSEQLHGKEMSFNNYVDADAAWDLVNDFNELAVAIIKHTNPSGVAVGRNNDEAYRRALSTDPASAFGGIVAFNRKVGPTEAVSVNEVFTEVVIAPDIDAEALEIFRSKKNLRVLRMSRDISADRFEYKQISGGMLVQDADAYSVSEADLKAVSEKQPSDEQIRAMLLAWKVCKHVKSNAIVIANEFQTLGVGSGQMNRVDSVRIASMRAERFDLPVKGAALASDAFFPFRDNVDEAAKLGISAIIQPGGSIKDEETIKAADEHGMIMVFTGFRHFKH